MSSLLKVSQLMVLAFVLVLSGRVHAAATDVFIAFESNSGGTKIEGQTQDQDMATKSAIEVSSVGFGMENQSTIGSATGGAGAGKISFKEVVVEMKSSVATSQLFLSSAKGEHFKKVTLFFRKSGGDAKSALVFFTVELGTVFVSALDFSNSDEGVSVRLTLKAGIITLKSTTQGKDGKLTDAAPVSWNMITNKAEGIK